MPVVISVENQELLIDDPIAWVEKVEEYHKRNRAAAQLDYHRRLEDLEISFRQKVADAYRILVQEGVIQDGDPAPWIAGR